MDRLDHGTAGAGCRELDRFQEGGQELADLTVPTPQVLVVVVIGRPDQVGDLGHGLGQLIARDLSKDRVAHATVGTPGVEHDEARPAEQQRGAVQVLERAEAALLAGVFDAGEHRGDQLVEQVEDVVERRDLLHLGEGQQSRVAAGRRHAGDGLRPCCGGIPGQGLDPHRRHGGQVDVTDAQGSDLLEPLEGPDQARHADAGRGAAESLQR